MEKTFEGRTGEEKGKGETEGRGETTPLWGANSEKRVAGKVQAGYEKDNYRIIRRPISPGGYYISPGEGY